MEILLCSDGSLASLKSAELILKLRFPVSTHVVLLGVSEKPDDSPSLSDSLAQMSNMLGDAYEISSKIRFGRPYDEILAEALESPYDLVAVGGVGKHIGILNSQLGSTTSRLARKLHTHFLITRQVTEQFGKILVCVSAEAPSSETVKIGGAWVAQAAKDITILHVVADDKKVSSPQDKNLAKPSTKYPDDLKMHDILLEQASKQLLEAGVKAKVSTKIRSGLIVDEVLGELSESGYDLLVVGAHYQPGQNRWHGMLLDDVTDQLLNRSSCSVLII